MSKNNIVKLVLLLSFAFTLSFSGCTKKELPEPVEGKPQVWVECNINNVPFKFEVGENYTFGCPVVRDGSGGMIRQFSTVIKSELHQKSIEFLINNHSLKLSSIKEDIEQSIKPGAYKFSYTSQFPYPYKLGEVIVNYKDLSNQNFYTSLAFPQVSVGHFEILSVKKVESDGFTYKLAEISFSCVAKNPANGHKYEVTDGHGFIPFGQQ